MRVDPFAPYGQLLELFLHRWLIFQHSLTRIEQGRPDHLIRLFQCALHKGKCVIAMQGRSNEDCRPGVSIKQNIFPRD